MSDDRAALLAEIEAAVEDYRKVFPEPYSLPPNLALAVRAAGLLAPAPVLPDEDAIMRHVYDTFDRLGCGNLFDPTDTEDQAGVAAVIAHDLMAVLPVPPDRDTIARTLFTWDTDEHPDPRPTWDGLTDEQRDVWRSGADAVLAVLSGRTEAQVKAEALREAAEEAGGLHGGLVSDQWLRDRGVEAGGDPMSPPPTRTGREADRG